MHAKPVCPFSDLSWAIVFLLLLPFIFAGCAATSLLTTASMPADAIKAHKFVQLWGITPRMVNTGIQVAQGDYVTIIASGEIIVPRSQSAYRETFYPANSLTFKIGQDGRERRLTQMEGFRVKEEGIIYLDYVLTGAITTTQYTNLSRVGSFDVDIIVWKRYDPVMAANYLQELSKKNPENQTLKDYAEKSKRAGDLYQAEMIAKNQVDETRTVIAALQGEKPEATDLEKERKIAELTERLKKAEQTQKDLETLKKREEEQKAKERELSDRLKELEESQKPLAVGKGKESESKDTQKEKQMAEMSERLGKAEQFQKELADLKKRMEEQRTFEREILAHLKVAEAKKEAPVIPPMIAIASPQDGISVDVETIFFAGAAQSDRGISRIEILVNQQPLARKDQRGLQILPKEAKLLHFSERIRLREGKNEISVVAYDQEGLTAKRTVTVQFDKKRQAIWAAVIGISKYKNIQSLKYASRDAQEFHRFLTDVNGVPNDHIWMLLDEEATLTKIRSVLGTQLRRNAGKDDLVIIYVAGHGATERDAGSPDGDGLEKYILPSETDPKDYYASAMPMGEVARILGRIRSERLVFIGDTCYSGASGGRTIPVAGVRSNVSGAFLERLSQGKGRVILTASEANEVSVEKDELKHGVFTYYLLEGLRGAADFDRDGVVTVDEAYRYVSRMVPQATGQEQHPVKKGETTGEIVLSVLK